MSTAAELVAEILAAPHDDGPWLVYSDWLQQRGDPRGELIQLEMSSASGHTDVTRRRLQLMIDEDQLLSERLLAVVRHWHFDFGRGFIRRADLHTWPNDSSQPDTETIHALFADPHVGLLESLVVAGSTSLAAPVLADASGSRLARLYVSNLGVHARRLEELEMLESLRIQGSPVQRIAHPTLRELHASPQACPALLDGQLSTPALSKLTCEMYSRDPNDHPLFTTPTSIMRQPPPTLVDLTLTHTINVISRVAECEIASQLRALRVGEGLGDQSIFEVLALRQHATAFPKLELVVLPSSVVSAETSAPLLAALAESLPGTTIDWRCSPPGEPPPYGRVADHDSRVQGFIDPLGGWLRPRPRRHR